MIDDDVNHVMVDELPSDGPSSSRLAQEEKRQRERSAIVFPYGDLDYAVGVARAVHQAGGLQCEMGQLAPALGHENKDSGAFRAKLTVARIFGLIEFGQRTITLTQLGQMVLDPHTERSGRVKAFLRVPLYSRIYDKYDGYTLPKGAALDTEMRNLGVPSKQAERARLAFMRSAEQAGLFVHGRDRLVLPAGVSVSEEPGSTFKEPQTAGTNGARAGVASQVDTTRATQRHVLSERETRSESWHPFIQGLLDTLPEPFSAWTEDEQQLWLATAQQIFKILYPQTKGR